MKILGLIDSFKGSLSSIELGEILKDELKNRNIDCDYIPISDGGEGFLDTINYLYNLEEVELTINDPLFRKINCNYLVSSHTNTAYIELAKACGIGLLEKKEYNPYLTSTFGLGEVIKDAINRGFTNLIIGIGGSSTNDGGSGMLEALGVEFYDDSNNLLNCMNNDKLQYINSINISKFEKIIKNINFTIISDVTNPLLGLNGATYIYSMQKGAEIADFTTLEANLKHYSNKVIELTKANFINSAGSGAAGGVGYAFYSFFNSKFRPGVNYILELINFNKIKNNYDYIITGEGKIDKQSLTGKVVFEIVKQADRKNIIVICAINEINIDYENSNILKIYSIVSNIATIQESLKYPEEYVRKLIQMIDFRN